MYFYWMDMSIYPEIAKNTRHVLSGKSRKTGEKLLFLEKNRNFHGCNLKNHEIYIDWSFSIKFEKEKFIILTKCFSNSMDTPSKK